MEIPNSSVKRVAFIKLIEILSQSEFIFLNSDIIFDYLFMNSNLISDTNLIRYTSYTTRSTFFSQSIDCEWLTNFLYLLLMDDLQNIDNFQISNEIYLGEYYIDGKYKIDNNISNMTISKVDYEFIKNINISLNVVDILATKYPLLLVKVIKTYHLSNKDLYSNIIDYIINNLRCTGVYKILIFGFT